MKLGGLLREAFDKAGVALPEKPRKKTRHKSGKGECSGQLIPDTVLSFSSATTGAIPPLKAWGRS